MFFRIRDRSLIAIDEDMAHGNHARPSFDAVQKERDAAQKETRTKLSKVLSEQQLKKFDVLTERPAMRGPRVEIDK